MLGSARNAALVAEKALATAPTNGAIGGAGFDVATKETPQPDNPPLNLRLANFILTPHSAWASGEAMQKLADRLIDNVEAFVAGRRRMWDDFLAGLALEQVGWGGIAALTPSDCGFQHVASKLRLYVKFDRLQAPRSRPA